MSRGIPLTSYIFRRLQQHGLSHCFGVPGDFTLRALDHVKSTGVKWVGNCNELNAGYAADGYARINGLGALFTTYGVGELSALNAVAGCYAEKSPIVHIVGQPQRHLFHDTSKLVHHALGAQCAEKTVFEDFARRAVAETVIFSGNDLPLDRLDMAICRTVKLRRPTYIGLPCDMVDRTVDARRLEEPLPRLHDSTWVSDKARFRRAIDWIAEKLRTAKNPLLLVDRLGMDDPDTMSKINALVAASNVPTLTMPSGAGMIDHALPNYYGVHSGPVGRIDTMKYVNESEFVIAFGPMFSDTQTLGWSVVPKPDKTVLVLNDRLSIPGCESIYMGCPDQFLAEVTNRLTGGCQPNTPALNNLGDFRSLKAPALTDLDTSIDQTSVYLKLNSYLRPHDIILLGNATPILGGRDFVLPDVSCRVIASGLWFSIGSMLPVALGAAMAQQKGTVRKAHPQGRVVLFDGDGSFQVTAQELSTIIHHRLNVTIFIINNEGYAYERLIHNADADYHDVAPWDYLSLPAAFGAAAALKKAQEVGEDYSIDTYTMKTWRDLESFLADERFDNGFGGIAKRGLKLIDVKIGKTDVPEKFRAVFENVVKALGGPTMQCHNEDVRSSESTLQNTSKG